MAAPWKSFSCAVDGANLSPVRTCWGESAAPAHLLGRSGIESLPVPTWRFRDVLIQYLPGRHGRPRTAPLVIDDARHDLRCPALGRSCYRRPARYGAAQRRRGRGAARRAQVQTQGQPPKELNMEFEDHVAAGSRGYAPRLRRLARKRSAPPPWLAGSRSAERHQSRRYRASARQEVRQFPQRLSHEPNPPS